MAAFVKAASRDRLPSEWYGHPGVGAGAGALGGLGLYGLWYLMSDRKEQEMFRKHWLRRLLGSVALGSGLGAASAYVFGPQPSDPYVPPPPSTPKPRTYWQEKADMLSDAWDELSEKWKNDWKNSLEDYMSQEWEDRSRRPDETFLFGIKKTRR